MAVEVFCCEGHWVVWLGPELSDLGLEYSRDLAILVGRVISARCSLNFPLGSEPTYEFSL